MRITEDPKFTDAYKTANNLVTEDTEHVFITLAKKGNRVARDMLFCKYLPLFYSMANSIKSKYNATADEMLNSAFIGMGTAINLFDPSVKVDGKPIRFVSFCRFHMYNMMQKCANGSLLVHHPENIIKSIRKLKDSKEKITLKVSSMYDADEYGLTPMDKMADTCESPDEQAISNERDSVVQILLNALPETERIAVTNTVMSDNAKTLREVGEELGLSHERVRQIRKRAFERVLDSKSLGRKIIGVHYGY